MMKKHSKYFLPLAFFAFIFILSNLFLYEDGVASPVNKVCAQDITRIELVVQYNTPDILKSLNNVSFTRSVEKSSSFVSKYLLDNKISPPPFDRCPVIQAVMNWRLDFPTKHIISIIQKTNRWHQSSDDEPSHLICS
jgi:hypothetical protein